jgi:glycosyltransferase involved in cell wall biosynthesis
MTVALSVIIPAFNEAQNIAACIESIDGLASEIIVIDNFSEDGTAEIARSLKAQVHQRTFDNFSANKNAAIELTSNDWILIVDADERLTPALRSEIAHVVENSHGIYAYRIPRETFFSGKRVRCWSGGSVTRLFKKDKASYPSSKLVHEELQVNGRTGTLNHPLEHYTFRSFDQYMPKVNAFTTLAARQAFDNGKRAGWGSLLFFPVFRFLRTYLIKGGILDGVPGLLIASLAAYTVYLKQAKLWELQKSR